MACLGVRRDQREDSHNEDERAHGAVSTPQRRNRSLAPVPGRSPSGKPVARQSIRTGLILLREWAEDRLSLAGRVGRRNGTGLLLLVVLGLGFLLFLGRAHLTFCHDILLLVGSPTRVGCTCKSTASLAPRQMISS